MGRPKGATNKFRVPPGAQAAFDDLLDGLGLDERALTDGSNEVRLMVGLRRSEATAIDDAAAVCGLPSRLTLVRGLIRSWLGHPWLQPRELLKHEFDDGHTWERGLAVIAEQAEWPEGVAGPAPVLATLLARLSAGDRVEVLRALAAELDPEELEQLRDALVRPT